MNKITTITAVAFLAISVVSCSKTSSGYLPVTVNQSSTKQEPVKVSLISNWQSLSFTPTTVNGISQMEGQSMLTQIVSYETGMHMQLAYVKLQGRDGFQYKSLPTSYSTLEGSHSFSFSIDFSTFKVFISNTDFPTRLINTQSFSGFQYMYIVIPTEVYQSLQINWNDLPAVAAALNFTL